MGQWLLLAGWVLCIGVGLALSTPGIWDSPPLMDSPHGNVAYELTRQWAETGKPVFPLVDVDAYPPAISVAFVPRDAGYLGGAVVPADFPLATAVFALIQRVAPQGLPLAVPVFGGLATLLFWLVAFELTGDRRVAWVATVVGTSLTAFWTIER